MLPIECEIKTIRLQIDAQIKEEPSTSISKIWNKKLIELSLKYGERQVAIFCPELSAIDSAFYSKKAKLVPKLPLSIEDIKDLPEENKQTK